MGLKAPSGSRDLRRFEVLEALLSNAEPLKVFAFCYV